MADTTVHIGENSPERIAYKLLDNVMEAEGMTWMPHLAREGRGKLADRAYLLNTYVECIRAVKGYAPEPKK